MRNLSSIIWAWGTFGYAPVAMPFLLEVAEARMQQCNDQDLANIMFGLASCDRPRLATPSLVKAAEQHACSIADSFSPQVIITQHLFSIHSVQAVMYFIRRTLSTLQR